MKQQKTRPAGIIAILRVCRKVDFGKLGRLSTHSRDWLNGIKWLQPKAIGVRGELASGT